MPAACRRRPLSRRLCRHLTHWNRRFDVFTRPVFSHALQARQSQAPVIVEWPYCQGAHQSCFDFYVVSDLKGFTTSRLLPFAPASDAVDVLPLAGRPRWLQRGLHRGAEDLGGPRLQPAPSGGGSQRPRSHGTQVNPCCRFARPAATYLRVAGALRFARSTANSEHCLRDCALLHTSLALGYAGALYR